METLASFNWLDIAIITIVVLSAVISVVRGFVKELLSLIIWGSAIFLGIYYAEAAGELFSFISIKVVRTGVGGFVVGVTALIIGGIISLLINSTIKVSGLKIFDRCVGAFFGIFRGVVIVCLLVLMIMRSPIAEKASWQQSALIPKVQIVNEQVLSYIPEEWQKSFVEQLDMLTL